MRLSRVLKHGKNKRAKQRSKHAAPAAEKARSAEDHRCDSIEFHSLRGSRQAGAQAAEQNDRGQATERAADHEHHELRQAYGNPGDRDEVSLPPIA